MNNQTKIMKNARAPLGLNAKAERTVAYGTRYGTYASYSFQLQLTFYI